MATPKYHSWQPDDEQFWRDHGHPLTAHFPQQNLLLLLAGACVWMIWAVLVVLMLNAGFPFSVEQYFSLIASAGLSAACIRMGGSFILHHCGVRWGMLLSAYLLYIPLFFLWWALASIDTPFWHFQLLAIASGVGGGLLMQVINNSYYLFPLKQQPLVQEVPLAFANSGLILVLVLMPLLVQWPGLTWLKTEPLLLEYASSNISGRVAAGTPVWLNTIVWLPSLLLAGALYWIHRLPKVGISHTKQNPTVILSGLLRSSALLFCAMAVCAVLLLPELAIKWLVHVPAVREMSMVLAIGLMLYWMQLLAAKDTRVAKQHIEVFASREVHALALLYLATMGSLLGLAVSFPLLIKVAFSLQGSDGQSWVVNPVAPSVLIYGWLPVVLGLAARAFGNWIAHRFKPGFITLWALLVMFVTALAMAYYINQARISDYPEQWFFYFLWWALLFFVAAGVASGAVMALILKSIPQKQLEFALTWIIALTTAGTFYIPQMFADHWQHSGPASIIVGFALFYVVALVVNWYFYLRSSYRA